MLPAEYSTYYCTSHAYTYTGHVCPERNALPISSHCSDPLVISLTHIKGFQTLSCIRTYQVVTHKMSSYRCAPDNHKQVFSFLLQPIPRSWSDLKYARMVFHFSDTRREMSEVFRNHGCEQPCRFSLSDCLERIYMKTFCE